ncbi:MAG: hypothetical protein LDLANPLL_00571 [Turneriella sp.]|nr:hypothetical protein [Turneriella sp.]
MAAKKGLYVDFHKIDLSHVKALIKENKINATLTENLLAYWERRLADTKDTIYSRYIEYYLFFESIKALFFATFVFDMKTGATRHSYGIFPTLASVIYTSVKDTNTKETGSLDFSHNGIEFTLHYVHSGYLEDQYAIAALSLRGSAIDENLKRMLYVFERYYAPMSFSRDERKSFLFSETEKEVKKITEKTLQEKKPVTFAYLYFESLTKYVVQSGENFARELLGELCEDVHRILKNIDHSFVLSTREILIVSLNCEKEIMEKRFARKVFHAKELLLAFQIKFHTVNEPIENLYSLWTDITGDIAYKRKIG